jgi:hypothetical protein
LPTRLRSDKPVTSKPALHYRLTVSGAALDLAIFPKRKVVARRILEKLAEQPCNLAQLKLLSATVGAQLKMLMAEEWIEQCDASTLSPASVEGEKISAHTFANAHLLTSEQQQAVDAVTQSAGFRCFLLQKCTCI